MTATTAKTPLATWKKWLIYTIALGASAILIWTQLPKTPYSTDLNLVGAGKPAIVLVYDVNTSGGMMVMELLAPIRDEYSDQVEFLVASLGLPDGRSFAQHYKITSGAVVFFSADASQTYTLRAPESTEELRQILKRTITQQNQE